MRCHQIIAYIVCYIKNLASSILPSTKTTKTSHQVLSKGLKIPHSSKRLNNFINAEEHVRIDSDQVCMSHDTLIRVNSRVLHVILQCAIKMESSSDQAFSFF